MPFFTIIATHYQNAETEEILTRFINSIKAQSFKDYELLILHDGPQLRETSHDVIWSDKFEKQYGHNLRQRGIDLAEGEYIIHTNCDNIYSIHALRDFHDTIKSTSKEIAIGNVVMYGMNRSVETGGVWYDTPRDYSKYTLLTGNPPVWGNMDLMSLCASKRLWKIYGWNDLRKDSDGFIYSKMCCENEYAITATLIGYHY